MSKHPLMLMVCLTGLFYSPAILAQDTDKLDEAEKAPKNSSQNPALLWERREFEDLGVTEFIVPSGVEVIWLFGCGGGGGGDLHLASGAGALPYTIPIFVRPGEKLQVELGAGGAGGHYDRGGSGTRGQKGASTFVKIIKGRYLEIEFPGGDGTMRDGNSPYVALGGRAPKSYPIRAMSGLDGIVNKAIIPSQFKSFVLGNSSFSIGNEKPVTRADQAKPGGASLGPGGTLDAPKNSCAGGGGANYPTLSWTGRGGNGGSGYLTVSWPVTQRAQFSKQILKHLDNMTFDDFITNAEREQLKSEIKQEILQELESSGSRE